MNLEKYFEIMHLAEKLKNNTRHSWLSSGRRESVAEHCYRLTLMAYFMKDEFKDADIDKVIRMCMFHDIGEAFTGDIPTFEKKEKDSLKEEKIVENWIDELPKPYKKELYDLFKEMEEQVTTEAKLYKALDRMEAVIQHNEADIRTWLPLEYELQLSYGEKETAFSKVTEKLKEHANKDTIEKIEKAKFAGYVKKDISDSVISDNIGIIRLVLGACFTNCYIVYNIRTNNCLVIDPADDAEKIIDNISKNGLNPQYILVTHGHTDHVLALGALKEKYNIPVVISRIDAPRLLDEELINERPYVEVPYKAVYPSVLLGEGDEIWLDDIRFETMILPGHTPGSAAFKIDFKNSTGHRTDENKDTAAKYMDAENTIYQVGDSNGPDNIKGIIFTGDTMLAGGHGKTSLPGGNEDDMMKSLQRLKDIDGNYLIYPGHKEITTLKKERQ